MSGGLDTSFGTGGFVTTNFGLGPNFQNYGQSIAIQTDGKIVMGGYIFDNSSGGTSTNHFALARYNTDGSLDTSFGTLGYVVTPNFASGSNDQGFSIGIQSDGKILMCGQTTASSTLASPYNFVLARYNTNGTLDTTSFGGGLGYVITNFSLINSQYLQSTANSLVIQPDGKIVLGGTAYNSSLGANGFALARYNTNGTLDTTTFGPPANPGIVVTGPFVSTYNSAGFSVALQSNSYIILGGQTFDGSVYNLCILTYDTFGTLDPTFGTGGVYKLNISGLYSAVTSVKVQTNDYIVFGVTVSDPTGIVPTYWLLGRLDTTGTLDPLFGTGGTGTVSTTLTSPSTLAANSVAIQTDGKIVVGGTYNLNSSAAVSFALARYTTDGTLDSSFGSAGTGLILTDLIAPPAEEYGYSLAIQTDGKILLGGYGGINNDSVTDIDFILARYFGFPPYPPPVVPICFPAGTPVLTDQGNIPIEEINPEVHTIKKKPIIAITQSFMNEDTIVCIEKHSLGINIPNKRTYISNYHGIVYNNKLIPAKQFVGRLRGVHNIKYNKEVLYNVLMEKHYIINVNNMRVETLNPKNIVAKLYTNEHTPEEKIKLILEINETSKNNKNNHNYISYNGYEKITHNTTRRKFSILRYNPLISRLNFHTKRHFISHNQTVRNQQHYSPNIKVHSFKHSRRRR